MTQTLRRWLPAEALAACLVFCAFGAAPATAATSRSEALTTAKAIPAVREQAKSHKGSHWDSTKQPGRWREQLWSPSGELIAEVFVSLKDGKVTEKWTGFQAAWTMARGYPGAFGKDASALWVWLPLLALFLLPFLPRGKPGLRHADIAAVALLSVSIAGFNRGRMDISVPTLYPPLLWLLGRMLYRGVSAKRLTPPPLRTLIGPKVMLVGIVFLIGFRAAFAIADGNVIDVGEASVIGGNRLASGALVYGHFPHRIERGDTYGPVTWAAYVPFALIFDADSNDGRMAAAGAAAITFDLILIGLIALLGWRLRGPPGALLLAWMWVTCPFTLYVAMCAANDTLPALLLVLTLLAGTLTGVTGAAARGASTVLGGLSKMATMALAPIFLRAKDSGRLRDMVVYALAFLIAGLVIMGPYLGDPLEVWNRTVGFQSGRDSPFTAWGYWHLPGWSRIGWKVVAGLVLLLATLKPRAEFRTPIRLAALSAAVLISLELTAVYWFYTYIVWFLPAVFVALAADWDLKPKARGEVPA